MPRQSSARAMVVALLVLAGSAHAMAADVLQANAALLRERLAYHIGTLAYIWGYPMVDMSRQMHNETHRVDKAQHVYAPVNHLYRFEALVTPRTAGNLRAPNNDTLYFGGWFDLREQPIVVRAPDTQGRYYTLAITDFYSEVIHVGRRTTGTAQRDFVLVGPGYTGTLPDGLHPVHLPTHDAWILGRLLVDGEPDLGAALGLLREFRTTTLADWREGRWPAQPPARSAQPLQPMADLAFFAVLNQWLRANPIAPADETLVALFDRVGFGANSQFDPATLDEATRSGLQRAIEDGVALLRASARQPMQDVRNGWIFPLRLGRYGTDYMLRASAVYGGYANLPEESTYVARVVDAEGRPLNGAHRYRLHFRPEQIPPAAAFWSLTPYDMKSFNLIENRIARYSIGNRTRGLAYNSDGSLDIYLQRDEPAQGASNWLPLGEGDVSLVLRIYEPGAAVFDGSYSPPQIQRQ